MKEFKFDIQRHRDWQDTAYTGRRRWSGSHGRLWVSGKLIFDVESFECKVTADREDVFIGMSKDSKVVSLTGEGTITVKRVFDEGLNEWFEQIKNGHDPRFTFVAAIQDPDMVKSQEQRIMIENVAINDFSPLQFKKAEVVTDEISFSFTPQDLQFLATVQE